MHYSFIIFNAELEWNLSILYNESVLWKHLEIQVWHTPIRRRLIRLSTIFRLSYYIAVGHHCLPEKKSNMTSNINLHITKLLREKAVFFSNFVYFCTCPDMPIWWYMCTYVFFWSRLFGLVAIANVGKVYYGWIMGPKVNPISSKANLTFDMIRTSYVIL